MKIVGCGGLGPGEKRVPIDKFSLNLSGVEKPSVLLIATPKTKPSTFEESLAKSKSYYRGLGVAVEELYDVFDKPPTLTEIEQKIGQAALINISGGDTLRAMERFKEWGVDRALKRAAEKDAVLAGTSAGAIAWFSRGHSDSLSYRVSEGEPWEYIWVNGLGLQPGVICPHYNSATEGGEKRVTSLARMVLESPTPITEPIYGIDNRAAIVVNGADIASISVDKDQFVHVVNPISGYSEETLPLVS